MAITKETIVDKIEVVGQYNAIQVRYAQIVKEDGTEIARKNIREAFDCGTITGDDVGIISIENYQFTLNSREKGSQDIINKLLTF